MPGGRPTKFTPAVQKEIARLFFLCFTDAQVAFYVGVNERTIRRARAGEFCPAIKKAEMEREANYRQRTWDGADGWQGTAWNLERKHPTQFSRPEVQFQITNNTLNQTVNNTLVVTAEVAHGISSRVREVDAKIERLLKDKGRGNGNGHHPEANGK